VLSASLGLDGPWYILNRLWLLLLDSAAASIALVSLSFSFSRIEILVFRRTFSS